LPPEKPIVPPVAFAVPVFAILYRTTTIPAPPDPAEPELPAAPPPPPVFRVPDSPGVEFGVPPASPPPPVPPDPGPVSPGYVAPPPTTSISYWISWSICIYVW